MLTIGNESFVLDAVSPNLERKLKIRLVPMSTASAVLRHAVRIYVVYDKSGTYVYCFGGIETKASQTIYYESGTYVYCFGGIETFAEFYHLFYWYLCLLLRRY